MGTLFISDLHLDGSRRRLRLLPLNFLNFLVSLINITRACFSLLVHDTLRRKELRWDKTARYRADGYVLSRAFVPPQRVGDAHRCGSLSDSVSSRRQ